VFSELFGGPPDGVWSAPGRLNLIGEHTDYNDGFVLPIALAGCDARAAVVVRADDVVRVASSRAPAGAGAIVTARLGALAPEPGRWADYVLGVVWALQSAGCELSGVDVLIDSDVPVGAGLSSSAAVECAVALALRDLSALPLGRHQLAALARHAENEFVGVPTGPMDQMASLCCTAGHALLLDTRTGALEQLPLDLHGAGLELVVIDTGVRHQLATSAYGERRATCEAAARELGVRALRDATSADLDRIAEPRTRRQARHVVTENLRVLEVAGLLRAGRVAAIGPLLTASHRSLARDYEVSCAELDLAVEVALDVGALGARMTGAGFGGCALALAPSPLAPRLGPAVTAAFADDGLAAPHVFGTTPGPGARRSA
jgi:galactokinase